MPFHCRLFSVDVDEGWRGRGLDGQRGHGGGGGECDRAERHERIIVPSGN